MKKEILTEFLYEVLTLIKAQDMKVNTDYPSLNVGDIESLKIPLPPKNVQEQIIAECQKIDQKYESSRMAIEEYRNKIAKIFSDLEVMARNLRGGGVKLFEIRELGEER
ncbi:restriction endonuclease subunit S, partial [Cardiobacterium hominis]